MLRLILCSKGVGNCTQPNFKTSYVTVNPKEAVKRLVETNDFKTSYVTVNQHKFKLKGINRKISKHLMLRLILKTWL